jgi:hypothetical protein
VASLGGADVPAQSILERSARIDTLPDAQQQGGERQVRTRTNQPQPQR